MEILHGIDLEVGAGRGPRGDGSERFGQEHARPRAHGPAGDDGHRGQHHDRGHRADRPSELAAGPGRALPGAPATDRGPGRPARGRAGRGARRRPAATPAGSADGARGRRPTPSGSTDASSTARSTWTCPGGERKRNEILQMGVVRPRFAVLDEIDSGLDVDALRAVARRVERATVGVGARGARGDPLPAAPGGAAAPTGCTSWSVGASSPRAARSWPTSWTPPATARTAPDSGTARLPKRG